eukprot:scaffold34020_cov122-Isochrysis_galbana.AAC.2
MVRKCCRSYDAPTRQAPLLAAHRVRSYHVARGIVACGKARHAEPLTRRPRRRARRWSPLPLPCADLPSLDRRPFLPPRRRQPRPVHRSAS